MASADKSVDIDKVILIGDWPSDWLETFKETISESFSLTGKAKDGTKLRVFDKDILPHTIIELKHKDDTQ